MIDMTSLRKCYAGKPAADRNKFKITGVIE
jgi:hypothetical protein